MDSKRSVKITMGAKRIAITIDDGDRQRLFIFSPRQVALILAVYRGEPHVIDDFKKKYGSGVIWKNFSTLRKQGIIKKKWGIYELTEIGEAVARYLDVFVRETGALAP